LELQIVESKLKFALRDETMFMIIANKGGKTKLSALMERDEDIGRYSFQGTGEGRNVHIFF
jgi:hypothetical protein